MDCATALPQLGEGTPKPSVQSALPSSPAALAACNISARLSGVSAEQASKRAPVLSLIKRSVKGVITGRGAEMASARRRLLGALRASCASSLRRASALADVAVMAT